MKPRVLDGSPLAFLVGALAIANPAHTGDLRVIEAQPASAWREAATMEVSVLGSGFGADAAIRFLVSGTDHVGGITVESVRFLSANELVAVVAIDSAATPGEFDIEIADAQGDIAREKRAFVIKPYSWVGRFGCTGAETWRRRIPCRRGAIDQ